MHKELEKETKNLILTDLDLKKKKKRERGCFTEYKSIQQSTSASIICPNVFGILNRKNMNKKESCFEISGPIWIKFLSNPSRQSVLLTSYLFHQFKTTVEMLVSSWGAVLRQKTDSLLLIFI